MMKFKPEECVWKAIHSDKVINHPNYIDIDRNTLEEFQLIHNDIVVYSLKKPKNKPFKLFARLRTYDMKADSQGSKVWVIGNNIPPVKFDIIDGETVEECKEYRNGHSKYDRVIFREEEK